MAGMDDFHAVFEEATEVRGRNVPLSGGNAEKNRCNRADIHNSMTQGKKGFKGEYDDFFPDPGSMAYDRKQAAAGETKHAWGDARVITDNVDDVERKMWQDAPKTGDYKLEDEWDVAYKEMVRDQGGSESTGPAYSTGADEEDEFDVI
eukprot:Rhum_TRINITY_DN16745_c0_g1::Rhum_TRINITY_DN16745_c0_g1_i1::g.164291::m.164291